MIFWNNLWVTGSAEETQADNLREETTGDIKLEINKLTGPPPVWAQQRMSGSA